jgi:glutamate formiminotransferase/formiminotetrahydrofolate cyclodeaminase
MKQLIECVPNFSEGRRREVIDRIVGEVRGVPGTKLLDTEMDADHNRAVVTFVGEPAAVEEAAFRAVRMAAQLIDMDAHRGEHPRIGATDVVPFVPVAGVTMDDCVAIARRVGERIGRELSIPVYLYAEAATRDDRHDLANIRRGEYEGLKTEIVTNPDRRPDFGPAELGKAGATVVGARQFLIAYNVNLGTSDLRIAKDIARVVRERSGGLPAVKALGMAIAQRGIVQVSMNLTDFRQTSILTAFNAVKAEAERRGVPVVGSEIVGLVPQAALVGIAQEALQLEGFAADRILETRLYEEADLVPRNYLAAVADGTPTPGGGSASALAGALGAALVSMVCRLTLGRAKFAAAEYDERLSEAIQAALTEAQSLQRELTDLSEEDSTAYDEVCVALKQPKGSAGREEALQAALCHATEVPLRVAERALRVLELTSVSVARGNPRAASDAGVAALMAHAAVQGAAMNVRTNLPGLRDAELAARYRERVEVLTARAEVLFAEAQRSVAARLGA